MEAIETSKMLILLEKKSGKSESEDPPVKIRSSDQEDRTPFYT